MQGTDRPAPVRRAARSRVRADAATLLRRALAASLRDTRLRDPPTDAAPADDATPNARKLADALLAKAIGGDLAAIKEVLDRTLGRPAQASAPQSDTPQEVVISWQDKS